MRSFANRYSSSATLTQIVDCLRSSSAYKRRHRQQQFARGPEPRRSLLTSTLSYSLVQKTQEQMRVYRFPHEICEANGYRGRCANGFRGSETSVSSGGREVYSADCEREGVQELDQAPLVRAAGLVLGEGGRRWERGLVIPFEAGLCDWLGISNPCICIIEGFFSVEAWKIGLYVSMEG